MTRSDRRFNVKSRQLRAGSGVVEQRCEQLGAAHARARRLLNDRRFDDYRREFAYDHPDTRPDVAEYAVEGLGGSIYYFWSMLRVVTGTARTIAVHNERVADELGELLQVAPLDGAGFER